ANTPEEYITEFEYHDGVYAAGEREFRGFGMVLTKDTQGNSVETTYHTGPVMQGRPMEQRVYDRDDVLFSQTLYTWDVRNIVPGSDYVFSSRTDQLTFDGDLDGRRTAEEYTYVEDSPGIWLLESTQQLGEVDFQSGDDITGDERTVHNEYTSNLNQWIIGLPKAVTVRDADDVIVRQATYYYDLHADASAPPAQGRLTRKEEVISTEGPTTLAVAQYRYSVCGNLIKTIDPKQGEVNTAYDPDYEIFPLVTTNDKQHTVTNKYFGINGEGLVSPEGLKGMWGQLQATTDPNAQTGKRDYDDLGRLTAQISPLDSVNYPTQTRQIEYLPTSIRHQTSTRRQHGDAMTVDAVDFYDALGRKIQTKTVSGEPGKFIVSNQVEYNERGLPVKAYLPYYTTNDLSTMDPLNPSAPFVLTEYDALGRVIKVVQPDGVTYSNVEYDDWTTTAYDENGRMQKSYVDAFGRLVRKEVYKGADGRAPDYPASSYELDTATEYAYDSEGNLIETRADADGTPVITRMGYDLAGRKEWMEDPDMGRWTYSYDANGNIKEQTDAMGQTITFFYDELNRLIRKSFSDGSGDVLYDYDVDVLGEDNDVGRLTNISYAAGGASFHYDELGREVSSTKTVGMVNYNVRRQYDALNNLTALHYPSGIKLEYDFNDAGQLVGVRQGDPNALYGDVNLSGGITSIDASLAARYSVGLVTLTEYQVMVADTNASGNVTAIDASQIARYAVGILTEFPVEQHVEQFVADVRYNVFGQLTYLLMGNGTRTYYRFNPFTQRLLQKKTFGPAASPQEDGGGWATADGDIQDFAYTYDAAGNILTITDAVNTATQTFTYDHLNRLISAENPGRYGSRSYVYDVLGNIREKDGKTYAYNQNCGGGPHAVCETFDPVSNESTFYAYDANGNMVAKQVFILGVAQELIEFEYDMENRLRRLRKDGNVKATYDYDGDGGRTRKVVDGVTTEFIGSLYEIGTGGASRHIYLGSQRIATVRGDRFHYYHTDHLGGTNVATDRDGAVREIREYRPFGAMAFSHVNYDDPADQGRFYFTQHYEDPESGLTFMQARYYDPGLGRFLTPDTIIPDASNQQAFNRYSYSLNDPVNRVDPSGHWSWRKFWHSFIGAAVGAIASIVTLGAAAPLWVAGVVGGFTVGAIT
ncbi:MAG: hypothetical protein K8I00_08670, partial [Candidatus Omnitrophica bacterium]|nr:hypothetical protein [Candidatus Omnitrophota bacterium]